MSLCKHTLEEGYSRIAYVIPKYVVRYYEECRVGSDESMPLPAGSHVWRNFN